MKTAESTFPAGKADILRLSNEAASSFVHFGVLPAELQLIIWSFAIPKEPRIIKIQFHESSDEDCERQDSHLTLISTPEPLLSLCRFSREACIKAYAAIIQPGLSGIIRFNSDIDIIYLTQDHGTNAINFPAPYCMKKIGRTTLSDVNHSIAGLFANIQNLALDLNWAAYPLSVNLDYNEKKLFLLHFRNLRRLTLVTHPVNILNSHSNDMLKCYVNPEVWHQTNPLDPTPREVAFGKWELEFEDFGTWMSKHIQYSQHARSTADFQKRWYFTARVLLLATRDVINQSGLEMRKDDVAIDIVCVKLDESRLHLLQRR